MLVMPVINMIKHLYQQGMSIREISQKTGHSRNTIRKYLNGGRGVYQRGGEPSSPKKDKIRGIIKQWIEEDVQAPRKQRRTRKKMYSDLVSDYDYDGSYSTVKDVVNTIKGCSKEVFVPRHHEPGMMGEFDFGEFYIELKGTRIKMYLHAYQLPYSNMRFGYISRRATQEEMFESHKRAFEHYSGVPCIMRYDNLKQAIKRVLQGTDREENSQFTQFREQQGFESEFCAPGRGNQKGDVEGCVGYLRRNCLTPVIKIDDESEIEEINRRLAMWCLEDAEKITVPNAGKSSAECFKIEKAKLNLINTDVCDVGKHSRAKVNQSSMVSVNNNFYSVPVTYAHTQVDVLLGARDVIVSARSKEIARHKRCFEVGRQILDAVHYIELYKRKPYTLINGKPIVELPNAFGLFFSRAYQRGCLKSCIDVISLLKTHSKKEVAVAIECAMAYDSYHSDGVKNILTQLHTDQPKIEILSTFKRPELSDIKIPSVDLNRYDTLKSAEHHYV